MKSASWWDRDIGRTQGLRLRENKRKVEARVLMHVHVHVHERSWLVVHLAHGIKSMQHARGS